MRRRIINFHGGIFARKLVFVNSVFIAQCLKFAVSAALTAETLFFVITDNQLQSGLAAFEYFR